MRPVTGRSSARLKIRDAECRIHPFGDDTGRAVVSDPGREQATPYRPRVSFSTAPSTLPADGPVWLVLVTPLPEGRHRVVAANAGNGAAHDVTLRQCPRGGIGPVVARATTVQPEHEVQIEVAPDLGDVLVLEWDVAGRRRRRVVDLAAQ